MEYQVGDKVVHRAHGGGTIVEIKDIELVEGFERYYSIEFPEKELTIHIPVGKMQELGLREVMAESKLEKVLNTLSDLPNKLAKNYKTRQSTVRQMLKTGRPVQLARAVRDLTWRSREHSLTVVDNRLLTQAREILAEEIALVREMGLDEAKKLIDHTVQQSDVEKLQSA